MPTFVVPSSFGVLREFNRCHTPAGSGRGGQFCGDTTMVGITSARPGRSNAEVFRTMREFEARLKATGVANVRVQPGVGAWEGGAEGSWVVSYRGNGAATRLIAQTAKAFTQDAVLMMKGCRGRKCDPAVEMRFDRAVTPTQRLAVQQTLVAHGLGGWTWFKSGGKTVLRMVAVPAWGGSRRKHLIATRKISAVLSRKGFGHRTAVKGVTATVLDASTYDTV